MPPRRLEIRPPLLSRAWVLVFMTVWCGFVVTAGVRALRNDPSPAVVLLVLMLAAGATMGYRAYRTGVVAEGDALVVRNHWRTHRWSRTEVEDFQEVQGSGGVPWGRSAQVLLADRTAVSLDVTQMVLGAAARKRLQADLERLRAWKDDRTGA